MRESLLTIPVNEVFEPKTGCPICRMRDTVESQIAEYIMGAAMMEPDVREETNKLGFCLTHYKHLLQQNNRLSLGLMLNTYLELARKNTFESKNILLGKNSKAKRVSKLEQTCFVCSKVDWGVSHMLRTVFNMYRIDMNFKNLFREQEYICIPHYNLMMSEVENELSKDDLSKFVKALNELTGGYMKKLNEDVSDFCDSFDYRNAGKLHSDEMEHVRNSVSRAILFLTGRNGGED